MNLSPRQPVEKKWPVGLKRQCSVELRLIQTSNTHVKLNLAHIYNLRVPTQARWEAETGESPKVHRPAMTYIHSRNKNT